MTTTAELPQYARIKRRIIAEIRGGQWAVGGTFPSEAQLVARYKVSRSTLVRSLQELVRDGYLYRRQGQGTFVADYRHHQGTATPLPLFFLGTTPLAAGAASRVLLNLLGGIETALGPGLPGVTIRQVPPGPLDEETRRLIGTLRPRAALVVEPSYTPELMSALCEQGCTIWCMNEPVEDANCVYIDQERAGYMATKYLLDNGRRRIALLNGPVGAYWGFAAKLRGYQRALEEAGVRFDPKLVREGENPIDSESGRAMLRSLMDNGAQFDGAVGVSDPKAMGAMALARELGLRLPEDLLIVGIDNTIANQADPPLTSVSMPFAEVGRQAALRAKQCIDQDEAEPNAIAALQQIRLQPTLEIRGGGSNSNGSVGTENGGGD